LSICLDRRSVSLVRRGSGRSIVNALLQVSVLGRQIPNLRSLCLDLIVLLTDIAAASARTNADPDE
jgi:hypothetical protein